MNADEFREILREVIRDELGIGDPQLGQRWEGGEMILKPGKEGTQEKRISIESMFAKVVSIRDKLRVLEQKINANGKLTARRRFKIAELRNGLLRLAHDVQPSLTRTRATNSWARRPKETSKLDTRAGRSAGSARRLRPEGGRRSRRRHVDERRGVRRSGWKDSAFCVRPRSTIGR